MPPTRLGVRVSAPTPFSRRVHQLRHPLIFYYGHPATLYINKLRMAGLIPHPINPLFESIFETGVDEMSWDDLSQAETSWPSVHEVHEYRQQVEPRTRTPPPAHAGALGRGVRGFGGRPWRA